MTHKRTLLLAAAVLPLLGGFAGEAFAAPRYQAVAQAADPAVTAAEKAVEDARAELRKAMAAGKGVSEARKALREAEKALADAKAGKGEPPAAAAPAAPTTPPAPPPAATGEATPPSPPGTPPPAPEAGKGTPPAGANVPTIGTPPGKPPLKLPTIGEKPGPSAPPGTPPAAAGNPPTTPPPGPETPPKGPPAGTATGTPPAAGGNPPAPPTAQGNPPTPPSGGKTPPPTPPADAAAGGTTPPPGPPPKPPANPPGPPPAPPVAADTPPPTAPGAVPGNDGRVIERENGELTIKSDDSVRFGGRGMKVDTKTLPDGSTVVTAARPDGTVVTTVRDAQGNIIKRTRKRPGGKEEVLIGNFGPPQGPGNPPGPGAPPPGGFRPPPGAPPGPGAGPGPQRPPPSGGINLDFIKRLAPLVVPIPGNQYIVESDRATQSQLEAALAAPPVERVERPYTLEEIRRSGRLRAKTRRIDVDTINFEFGAASVPDDQVPRLQVIGQAMSAIIARNPDSIFLIEGHTDAVGSDLANLALSDRRAESVAQILTYYYNVPPENLITQGYGEQYLKIPTALAERENRRVTVRNITELMRAGQ